MAGWEVLHNSRIRLNKKLQSKRVNLGTYTLEEYIEFKAGKDDPFSIDEIRFATISTRFKCSFELYTRF